MPSLTVAGVGAEAAEVVEVVEVAEVAEVAGVEVAVQEEVPQVAALAEAPAPAARAGVVTAV
jgi:hypothetical protein